MSNTAISDDTGTERVNIAPWKAVLGSAREKFNEINAVNNFVNYDTEAMFAMQLIMKNEYLMKIANSNPQEFRNAVINIAAIGLSLNPATKFAYLVPRKGAVCLDISYIGLIKLATDTGSIQWARAELIHENDEFIYHGATRKAEFICTKPFNRGAVLGVYCEAKTKEGDYLTGIMSAEEVFAIRDRSEAFKQGYGPWKTDEGEMIKKTIIKRESKTWPKTDKSERFDRAVEVINEHEGINFEVNEFQQALDTHRDTIDAVCQFLTEENYEAAAECYFELTNEEMMSINKSPTACKKLGIEPPFTTSQLKFIKEELSAYHPMRLLKHEDNE